jgi:membrane protein YqaA with SNARE-associated domain
VALAVPLAVLASHHRGELSGVWAATAGAFKAGTAGGATGLIAKIKAAGDALLDSLGHVPPSILLLSLATYMSVSTTFLPLPTGPVLAAMAMRGVVSDSFVVVLLLVPIIAALGSTLANLNDYHLFLLMLRNRHVAKVRHTKTYQVAARWFSRSPFLVIVIFNILPLPVDVVRMVSAIYGYGRKAFAASNFIGRLIRYMICAGVTFMLGKNGRIVVLAMLAIAVAMGLCKLAPMIARRIVAKSQ